MGKYSTLINDLYGGPKAKGAAYFYAERTLASADGRAFRPMVRALASHKHAQVRETVAEILGERGEVAAIPYLLDAVVDPDDCVRMDAIWAIEKILHFRPGGLEEWLEIHYHEPEKNKAKLKQFLDLNKRYIADLEV